MKTHREMAECIHRGRWPNVYTEGDGRMYTQREMAECIHRGRWLNVYTEGDG